MNSNTIRLNHAFFAREAPIVARDLLGRVLVRQLESGEQLRGRIVETEAYHGLSDTASHARAGDKGRAALMYGEASCAYIYLIYGMYHMLNVVTDEPELPAAVLIRAVEPLEGIDTMLVLRPVKRSALTNGPGKLCQAMAIDRSLNGEDVIQSEALWFEPGVPLPHEEVGRSPRIGIDYAEPEHRELLWRFFQIGNKWVS
ncbi:MAG: DNA-3-methyladenine glycosylase [Ardenticatenales bacterium]|nr:DNA-3-methyladenine glycosylase [Ardenticatenales bacterium]